MRWHRDADALLDGVADAFLAIRDDGRLIYLNRATEELLGRPRADLLGKAIWDEFPQWAGGDLSRACHLASSQRRMATVGAFQMAPDRWHEVRAYPAAQGTSVFFRDLGERPRSEREGSASDKQRQLYETALARRAGRPPPRAAQRTDDLTDLLRMGRGKLALRKQRLALAGALQRAADAAQPTLAQAGQRLELTAPPDGLVVDADSERLAQVLDRLIDNAVASNTAGGQVTLAAVAQGGEVEISVSDDGPGLDADQLPQAFELFAADGGAPADRSVRLALVKGLTELQGGSVRAHSGGAGLGARFSMRLPLADPVTGSPDRTSPGVGCRVLVVDDNSDAALGMAEILRIMGYQTAVAHDGLAALATGEAFAPDAVLLDIGMPMPDGYETARRIRQAAWGRHVLLLALTGWGSPRERELAQEVGFDHFLVKPAEPEEVQRLLQARTPRPPD